MIKNQVSKVGMNLKNFMRDSDIGQVSQPGGDKKHNFALDNSEIKSVGNMSELIQPNVPHKSLRRNRNERMPEGKDRAKSLENFKQRFNSTGASADRNRNRGNAIKQGLSSFIKRSNIDIDELSANLSQKQEGRRAFSGAGSRSRSDQSRRARGSTVRQPSHGLPLPKQHASKRLAETYRREAQARKNKFEAEINTPESKSRREIPQPVEMPQILNQHYNQNEQTFENLRKLMPAMPSPGKKPADSARLGQSPNFFDPDHPQESGSRNNERRQEIARAKQFSQSCQNLTLSEQRQRPSSCHQDIRLEDLQPDRHAGQIMRAENQVKGQDDIHHAPVGTIVRVTPAAKGPLRKPHAGGNNYSTFGGLRHPMHSNIQSMSPLKQRGTLTHETSMAQEAINQSRMQRASYNSNDGSKNGNRSGSQQAAGRIVRQSDLVSRKSGLSHHNQHDFSQERLIVITHENKRQSHIQTPLEAEPLIVQQSHAHLRAERIKFFIEPLFEQIWDCFTLNLEDLEELLLPADRSLEFRYQEIRDQLQGFFEQNQERLEHVGIEDFMHQQTQLAGMIREAVKIVSKERLTHMLLELSRFHTRLVERRKDATSALKEQVALQKAGKSTEAEACKLKHHILRDIVKRLMQKIVIYALQLRVYHKQETCILFEEYYHSMLKARLTKFTLIQMRKYKARRQMKREKSQYAQRVMINHKVGLVFGVIRNLKMSRYYRNEHHLKISQTLELNFKQRVFLNLKQVTDKKAMCTLDSQLLKLFAACKYRRQVFVRWRQANLRLKKIKQEALEIVKEKMGLPSSPRAPSKAGQLLPRQHQPLAERELLLRLAQIMASLRSDRQFIMTQTMRQLRIKQIKLGEIKMLRLLRSNANEDMLQRAKDRSYNLPLQLAEAASLGQRGDPTFKSLIKNQNPAGYKGASDKVQIELKYDIHSLLVDTQNYFYNETNSRLSTFAAIGGGQNEGPSVLSHPQPQSQLLINQALVPAGYIQSRQPELSGRLEETGSFKVPNQLFAQLLKKNLRLNGSQRLTVQASQVSLAHRFANASPQVLHQHPAQGQAELQAVGFSCYHSQLKIQLHLLIHQTVIRIDDLIQSETFHRHYSFAVKFLIKEEQNLLSYREGNDNGTYTQTVSYTNTRRSPVREELQESFIESSPGQPDTEGYGSAMKQQRLVPVQMLEGPRSQYEDRESPSARDHQDQRQPVPRKGPHAPAYSVTSWQKESYSLEDYVQFAQSQIQLENEGQEGDFRRQKLCREMFMRLQIAKSAGTFYSRWKIAYAQHFLERSLDELHSLHLVKQYFQRLRKARQLQAEKAERFLQTSSLRNHFSLFMRWRDANYQLLIQDNKTIKKFKTQQVWKVWVDYMTLKSDYMVMIIQAQRYNHQAMASKALLSLYTHYLKESKARKYRQKQVLRKFFRRAWMPQYHKSKALRKVMKRFNQKTMDWERTRYQREFNSILDAFEQWRCFVVSHGKLLKEFNALNHFKHTLMIKALSGLARWTRIKRACLILNGLVLGKQVGPCFQQLVRHGWKSDLMQRDWREHRQVYRLRQMLAKWREHTVKQKLARMLVKKHILRRLKDQVYKNRYLKPYLHWERQRKKIFFSVMAYLLYRHQRDDRFEQRAHFLVEQTRQRVMKKVMVCLLRNIYERKKERILIATVESFRKHHLLESTFKLFKIGCLNVKKQRILDQVAAEFRQVRVMNDAAYLVTLSEQHDQSTIQTIQNYGDDKVMLQKVFTCWLQFTLENFIKSKVMMKFQAYRAHKMQNKIFKAWRNVAAPDKYANSALFEDRLTLASNLRQSVTEMSTSDLYAESHLRRSQATSHSGIKHLKSSYSNTGFVQTTDRGAAGLSHQRSQMDFQRLGQGDLAGSYGRGTQEFTPEANIGARNVQRQRGAEDGGDGHNQFLFNELEAIFSKNKKWMEEQKDREIVIKRLADQYQEKMLAHSVSHHTRSRVTQHDQHNEGNDSVVLELDRMRQKHRDLIHRRLEDSSQSREPRRQDQRQGSPSPARDDYSGYSGNFRNDEQSRPSQQSLEQSLTDYLKTDDELAHSRSHAQQTHGRVNRNDESSLILGDRGNLLSSNTNNSVDHLVYSGQTGAYDRSRTIKSRRQLLDRELLEENEVTKNTDEILARMERDRPTHANNKSELSVSSFSQLARRID